MRHTNIESFKSHLKCRIWMRMLRMGKIPNNYEGILPSEFDVAHFYNVSGGKVQEAYMSMLLRKIIL